MSNNRTNVIKKMAIVFSLAIIASSITAQNVAPYYCGNDLYGLANHDGEVIVPCQYESITERSIHQVFITKKNDKFGLVDMETGDVICEAYFPNRPGGNIAYVRDWVDEKFTTVDTVNRFGGGQHYLVYDKKGKIDRIKCFHGIYETQRFSSHSAFSSHLDFYFDIWRYKVPDGGVNFYHKKKKKLMNNDVINGLVMSKDRLAIEGENGKIALCDLSGKELSRYEFMDIHRINDESFTVNATPYDWHVSNKPYANKAGVIDQSGQLVVDTMYSKLQIFGEDFLFVGKDGMFGVLDKNYQFVLPMSAEQFKPGSKGKIIIEKDRAILDLYSGKKYEATGPIKYNRGLELYSIQKENGIYTMLDAELKEIFTGEAGYIQKAVKENTFKITGKKGIGYLVREDRTFVEVDAVQLVVKNMGPQGSIIQAQKDSLYGLIDEDFNVLFETIYERPGMYIDGDVNYILMKLHEEPLYSWYDFKGQPVDRMPVADPAFVSNGRGYRKVYNSDGDEEYLFRDGSIREKPAYKVGGSHVTPAGRVLFVSPPEKGDKQYYVLDEYLYNILPEGFFIPNKYFNARTLKTGLITVYDDFTSGVINDLGEWEIEPTEHGYQVLSPNLVTKSNGAPGRYSKGGTECLAKQNGQWISAGNFYGINNRLEDGWLTVSRRKENGGGILMGLLDSMGRNKLPLAYSKIDVRNEYIIANGGEEGNPRTEIYSIQGDLLLNTPYWAQPTYDENHFIIKDPVANLEGLVNLQNEVVLAPQYTDLNYFPQSKCISYVVGKRPDHEMVISSLEGKLLMQAKYIQTEFFEIDGLKRMLLQADGKWKLYDENLQVMGEGNLKFKDKVRQSPEYFRCITADKKYIYVSLKTGKILMK